MGGQPFKDAEAWLAEQGIRRDRLRIPTDPPAATDPGADRDAEAAAGPAHEAAPPAGGQQDPDRGEAPVSAREAARLAAASDDETLRRADEAGGDPHRRASPRLEDEVAEAVAFARRSTANAPQAEARVAGKLRDRGWPDAVVEQALGRCRRTGILDDHAMAAALVTEGRRKGHAPRRLRADLRRRELAEAAIEAALADVRDEDPEAAAFAVAKEKAASLTGVSAEAAFRRVVGHLARRGHPEALARKVARAAVFDTRDPERTAGR